MENNYFIKTNSMVEKKSYLSQPNISPVQDIYTMGIESEVDIFSDIPLSLFSETAGRQISSVMTKFKREYIRYICQKESYSWHLHGKAEMPLCTLRLRKMRMKVVLAWFGMMI